MMMITSVQGLLQVHHIPEENGYTKIRMKEVDIVNDTDTILHIVNPGEMMQILNNLESNINLLNIKDKETLYPEVNLIKSKIRTISRSNRQKRGLINAVGRVQNWLFGTMDDSDREEILEHLKITDENNHASINNLNKQIKINENYNRSLSDLKIIIENDRTKILESLNTTNEFVRNLNYKILVLEQSTMLRYLENKVNKILDNIMAAKNNIIHPSMLTLEELETYNIDFHTIQLLKAGVMEYNNQFLLIAIKIPVNYISTELKIIKPIPNSNYFMIDEEEEFVIEVNDNIYKYEEKSIFKNLKKSKNCVFSNSCHLVYNNVTSIEEIDGKTLLLKNMFKELIYQNCDQRIITLNGNYLINYNNCTIKIKQNKFTNREILIPDKYFYPSYKHNEMFVKPLDFNKIIMENEKNLDEIKELKYHKKIIYGSNISLALILILSIIGVIIFILLKTKEQTIKIVNNLKPETSDLKGGGVTANNLPTLNESSGEQPIFKPLSW